MRYRVPTAALGVAVCAGAMLAGAPDASARVQTNVIGYAGGSIVRAANNAVTSDLSAASMVYEPNKSQSNSLARASVADLLSAQTVSTTAASQTISGGVQVTVESKLTGVSALGGVITASSVDTKTVSKQINGKGSSTTNTTFAGLKVVGAKLPLTIRKNLTVSIPGVATVTLNYAVEYGKNDVAYGLGAGIAFSLLKPRGRNATGAGALLTPTYAAIANIDIPDTGHTVAGRAYGTSLAAKAGTLAGIQSDPTAPVTLPPSGQPHTSSIASANLAPTLHIGAVKDTVAGINTTALGESTSTSTVANVNLFNGLVTADAVGSNAHVRAPTRSAVAINGSSKLANLKIGGKAVPTGVAPNTKISLGRFATVIVNQQVKGQNFITVRALDITLTTQAYGLPAGAEIQVAVAGAAAT